MLSPGNDSWYNQLSPRRTPSWPQKTVRLTDSFNKNISYKKRSITTYKNCPSYKGIYVMEVSVKRELIVFLYH